MQFVQSLIFLILFPLVTALFMLVAKKEADRSWIVKLSAVAVALVTIWLLVTTFDKGALYSPAIPAEPIGLVMFILEILIAVFILYLGIKHRKYHVIALILVQSVMMIFF